MRSFFTYEQWQWIKERYDEGYSMTALAEFLGINRRSIRVAFVRLGFYPGLRSDLPPLAGRRKEFLERGVQYGHSARGGSGSQKSR